MTLRTLGDLIIYLGAIAAALAAMGVVAHWAIVRPLRHWLTKHIAEQITPALDHVRAEMSPNNGSSVKDAVDRVETKVDQLADRLDQHITHHPDTRQER